MIPVAIHSFETKFGTFRTAATAENLVAVQLPTEDSSGFEAKLAEDGFAVVEVVSPVNAVAESQIKEYCEGIRRTFDLPLQLTGTQFQCDVLAEVAGIPYGRTMTYAEVARAMDRPKAARAVGAANARNPLPLVIPCHRVVASSGLGGYGGGLELKRALLRLEGVSIP